MTNQVKILGNKIDCFPSYSSLFNYIISKNNETKFKGYVTVNNVHTIMEAYWDRSYSKIINSGFLSIPDGKPLEIVGRIKGNKIITRLFGPSVMEQFIDWGRQENFSHFFFGNSNSTLQKLKSNIEQKYPGAIIAGMVSPPFGSPEEWDNDYFIQVINQAKPDFIWIGLGAPKQELWMYQHYQQLNQGIMFGIGAGFDYLAGNTRHAPQWMKNASLEWLYRLLQNPGRLWKRYVTTIPPFIFLSIRELIAIKMGKSAD